MRNRLNIIGLDCQRTEEALYDAKFLRFSEPGTLGPRQVQLQYLQFSRRGAFGAIRSLWAEEIMSVASNRIDRKRVLVIFIILRNALVPMEFGRHIVRGDAPGVLLNPVPTAFRTCKDMLSSQQLSSNRHNYGLIHALH